MTRIGNSSGDQILAQLRDMQTQMQFLNDKAASRQDVNKGPSFMEHLQGSVNEVKAE